MTDKQKLKILIGAIKKIIEYPEKRNNRRANDGYPAELIYDEYAYKRMVDTYRNALRENLKRIKGE